MSDKTKGLGAKLRAWKDRRKINQLARLTEKGKVVSSQYMTKTGEGTYSIDSDNSNPTHTTVTDPKGKVTGETSTDYKVSRKGKIKKQL